MFGSVFKNTAKNKEYRYREIVSKYPAQFTDTKRLSPPEPFPNYPRPPRPLFSEKLNDSGVNYLSPRLPKYLSILTLDPVSSPPLKEKDLFTSKGVTIISEVVNDL